MRLTEDQNMIITGIDNSNIDTSIFGTGKLYKEKMDEKKENLYSDIDDMLNQTLKPEEE